MQLRHSLSDFFLSFGIAFYFGCLAIPAQAAEDEQEVQAESEWSPGDPVPPGYTVKVDHTARRTGAIILVASYGVALLEAASGSSGCMMGDCNQSSKVPLLLTIPVVGPWIAFPSASDDQKMGCLLTGIGQGIGAAVLAYSIAFPNYELVKISKDVSVLPVPLATGGVGVVGRF